MKKKSDGEIEYKLGLRPGLLMKWHFHYHVVKKRLQEIEREASDLEVAKLEIRRLEKELAEAVEERDILRKAVDRLFRKV